MKKIPLSLALGALSFANSFQPLAAAAYQTWGQSANSIGYAHADMAALADDASTAWYNPAGMTNLCSPQISFGGTVSPYFTEFRGTVGVPDTASLLAYINANGFSLTNTSLTNATQVPYATGNSTPVLGAFYGVYPLHFDNFSIAFGLSVTSPWKYETNWSYSYLSPYATRTYIDSVQINPSVAFSYGNFSIGVGYGSELLRTQLHSSLLNFEEYFDLKDWGNTWNIGALYSFSPNTRIGITYRAQVNHHLSGTSHVLSTKTNSAKSLSKLPGTLAVGGVYEINPCWSALGTFVWSNWSRLKEWSIDSGINQVSAFFPFEDSSIVFSTATPTVPFHARDSFLVAIGSKYVANDYWTLKCGFAWDRSAIRERYRELRIPDNDHYHVGLGARCDISACARVDLGMQYVYIPKCGLQNVPVTATPLTISPNTPTTVPVPVQGFVGSIFSSAFTFSIQASIIFP